MNSKLPFWFIELSSWSLSNLMIKIIIYFILIIYSDNMMEGSSVTTDDILALGEKINDSLVVSE